MNILDGKWFHRLNVMGYEHCYYDCQGGVQGFGWDRETLVEKNDYVYCIHLEKYDGELDASPSKNH